MGHFADNWYVIVNPDAPSLDFPRGTEAPKQAGGPGRGRQAEGGVIGQGQAFVIAVKGQHHQDRTENLILDDFGPLVGAAVIITMQNYLSGFGEWVLVIQGVIFVATVLLFRRGIVGEIVAWTQRSRAGDKAAAPVSAHGHAAE